MRSMALFIKIKEKLCGLHLLATACGDRLSSL